MYGDTKPYILEKDHSFSSPPDNSSATPPGFSNDIPTWFMNDSSINFAVWVSKILILADEVSEVDFRKMY